ncbi:serine/threonine protein kinase [Calothrix sp. FACHB-1219]|uniref:serine/threonine-protein kinase n=1 Tax=unclassified Calothrix TaxID=2619626 RepID=UPI00168850D7|nr:MULTISPECIES: serine/threonine-protein kinase [unclassified Calothrix]MBD2201038.1 serine/threonine protein kinase [Calothrix sp. FACHB-168]MBD2215471.1 serine/threonine protein kinase [Calothrix sp. FACHB-1219]
MLIQDRYRLIRLIGKGGFCKTYLAVDENEFPPVPCVVQQFSQRSQTPKSFIYKAQQLKILGQHPQIPSLIAYFQDEQYCYLVQEFIAGSNLSSLLESEGALNENQIWQLLADILPVIKLIHYCQIIHCNIKPENIIFTESKKFVLVNLAATQIFSEINQFISQDCIGSPEYIAPEQTRGKAVFASDFYSLGVTCIHLMTQISPFDLYNVANDCWVWQEYLSTTVSNRLSNILTKLLHKSIRDRFQSADEVMLAMGIDSRSFPSLSASQPSQPLWECIHTLQGIGNVNTEIHSLAFSPDGKILASGDEKIIKLWDLNSQKVLTTLSGHTHAVKSLNFSPDGKILASASDDRSIKLWDISTSEEICTLLGHTHAVKSVAFSPDGKILASGSWDKTIKLWDVNTREEISTLTGHQLQVNSVAFSPQGQILASASLDRTVRLWELLNNDVILASNNITKEFKNRPNCTLLGTLSGHAWAVLTVAFSPDGKILATGSDDNTIKLWQVNTGQVITTLLGHSWSVVAVAFTIDGTMLISASRDRTVKLWQVSTAKEIATLSGHADSVSTVAVSQVAQLIASASKDKTIKLWQLAQQES